MYQTSHKLNIHNRDQLHLEALQIYVYIQTYVPVAEPDCSITLRETDTAVERVPLMTPIVRDAVPSLSDTV